MHSAYSKLDVMTGFVVTPDIMLSFPKQGVIKRNPSDDWDMNTLMDLDCFDINTFEIQHIAFNRSISSPSKIS